MIRLITQIKAQVARPPDLDPDGEAQQPDMRSLTRLGIWGGSAAAALLVVAIAAHTDAGQRRIALAFQNGNASPQIALSDDEQRRSVRDTEIENRRLSDQLRNLSEDRDRLLVRMTALERNYEDVTGSISKLGNAPKPVLPELAPAAAPATLVAAAPPAQPSPPPEVAPVASVPAPLPQAAVPAPVQPPPLAPQIAAPQAPAPQAAAPAPESVEGIPARTEFGIDLGGAPSVAALRVAWDRIRRNHGVQLEGLRPVIGIRDGRAGHVELRLVVGPITNAAAAAKLCASLAAAGLSCQPTTFDGQRLALR